MAQVQLPQLLFSFHLIFFFVASNLHNYNCKDYKIFTILFCYSSIIRQFGCFQILL